MRVISKRKMQHMGTFKGHDKLSRALLQKSSALWDSDYLESLSFSVSNSIIKTNVFLQGGEAWLETANESYFFPHALPCLNNARRHSHTLFIAIPGIFRPPSLLLRGEAGDWLSAGASTLWPMWNSSARIGLACAQRQAQTHTDPHHTQHRLWRALLSG